MLLHTAVRIAALVIAPAMFSVNIDRDFRERPRVSVVEPRVAAPGEFVAALGTNLDRSRVVELLLSRGDSTSICRIVEQKADLIRFRVPRSLDPGLYRIVLVADARWGTEMIDQDVVLTVVGLDRSVMTQGQRHP